MSLDTLPLFVGRLRITLVTSLSVTGLNEKPLIFNFSLIVLHVPLNSAKVSGSPFKLRFLIILEEYLLKMVAFLCVTLISSTPSFIMIYHCRFYIYLRSKRFLLYVMQSFAFFRILVHISLSLYIHGSFP